MPVHKCPNGKYRIGNGKCQYTSKEAAEKAYKAYLAKKHSDKKNELSEQKIEKLQKQIQKDLDDLYEADRVLRFLKDFLATKNFKEKFKKIQEKVKKDLEKIDNIKLEKLKTEIVKQLEEWKK